ncbi:MAG: DUF4426 domain-containing protein [Gammaproteobacteria bacterium]
MHASKLLIVTSLSALFALTACQKAPETRSAENVPTAREAAPRTFESGDYVVHYNAITTDQLLPEAARAYGISRSKTQALLNVVLHKKTTGSDTVSTSGKVSAKANNLTGQLKNLEMEEIRDGDVIYYIGQTSIADGEFLTFKIQATPDGETTPIDVTFQQQFYTK